MNLVDKQQFLTIWFKECMDNLNTLDETTLI